MEQAIYISVIVIELMIIIFLGMNFFISIAIISRLRKKNDSLTQDVEFHKRVAKTFEKGLEAFNNFKNQ